RRSGGGKAWASGGGGGLRVGSSSEVSAVRAGGVVGGGAVGGAEGGAETVTWTYNPAAADLDWLRQGDTLTLTYVAQVNDGHGNVGAQNRTITITGSNDVPAITAESYPGSVAESAGDSSAPDIPAITGTITVSDTDVGDTR